MTVEQQAPSKEKKSLLGGFLSMATSIWGVAILAALLAVFGALTILNSAAATTTYYVLGHNVPARTQITADMLLPVETSINGAPASALDQVAVRDGSTYSKIALKAGDIVTTSNSGPLTQITDGLPGDFVAASFAVTPDNAVAGKVSAGDKIDLIATSDEFQSGRLSRVVLHNVLVLDVAVAPNTIAEAAGEGPAGEGAVDVGPEGRAIRNGIPSVYTVGVSPEDAAKIALVRGSELMITLSSNEPQTNLDVTVNYNDLFTGGAVDNSSAKIKTPLGSEAAAEETAVDGAGTDAEDASAAESPEGSDEAVTDDESGN